jgi:hypothetical protein
MERLRAAIDEGSREVPACSRDRPQATQVALIFVILASCGYSSRLRCIPLGAARVA